MAWIAGFTFIALGLAHMLRLPGWSKPAILLAVTLFLLATQIALPPQHPMRLSVAGSMNGLVLFGGIGALAYAYWRVFLRPVRRRAGIEKSTPGKTGAVLIEKDARLREDMGEDVRRFSLAWRAESGEIASAIGVTLRGGRAELTPLGQEGGLDALYEVIDDELAASGAKVMLLWGEGRKGFEPVGTIAGQSLWFRPVEGNGTP